jgi:3-phytase
MRAALLLMVSAWLITQSVVPSFRSTAQVPNDPDDPALWVHPGDPARSLILGTDKMAVTGGLYVFRLDGTVMQAITPIDRPNNVDVEYGLPVGGRTVDIAVVTERKQRRLRVFAIPADGGMLYDVAPGGIPVLGGQEGEAGEPMGVALYKRPRDGAIFAIVAPKTGAATDYLWQYRLRAAGSRVEGQLVRRFGAFSRQGAAPGEIGEIEAVVADDDRGYVYYADERFGVRTRATRATAKGWRSTHAPTVPAISCRATRSPAPAG